MSQRKRKSSGSSVGLIGVGVAALIGVGVGYLFSKIFQPQAKKEEQKPIVIQKMPQQSFTKTDIDTYDQLEELMTCPITHQIMSDPCVLTSCGHTFQRKTIEEWIKKNKSCPLCIAQASQKSIKANFQLKEVINHYQRTKNVPKN